MATLKTWWLLSIWVLSLTECFALAGPPAPPSSPECYIPHDKIGQARIHCTWEPGLDPQIPINYSLYWEQLDRGVQHVLRWANLSGSIDRRNFSYGEDLHVWVQAKNQHGSANSSVAKFNPAEIYKPPPPEITLSHQDPLEIFWTFTCQPQHSTGQCDVRHRTKEDPDWVMEEEASYRSYSVHMPQTCTSYDFQVRCVCDPGLKSGWSPIYRTTSKEMAPVGKLDVWRDCGISPESSDCVLAFKKFSPSQACGSILGYKVSLSLKNGSVLMDTTVCKEAQCHFNYSLKDVSSASVSAFNRHGASVLSNLSVALTGKEENERDINLNMTEEYLTLSWDDPHWQYDNLTEYVVQYKQAGRPLGQGFDWVRVPTNQTTATFKGQFKKFTPYRVSLLIVSDNQVHHLSSAVGFSVEGSPPKVPAFGVSLIAATHATVTWQPIPLLEQHGTILYYQIGVNKAEVYNVSASKTSEQLDLRSGDPGQEYKVWIRAVTAAGPGKNSTISFKTLHHNEYLKTILLGILLTVAVVVVCVIFLCVYQAGKKVCCLKLLGLYEKVPDPRNSNIFRQMNDPLGWICIPVNEPHPKISLLEVVEVPSWPFKSITKKNLHPKESVRPMVDAGSSQMDCTDDRGKDAVTEESHRTDQKYGRQAYSKIVDSDEERDAEKEGEEDRWSSSRESVEPMEFGYEKHFMPTSDEEKGEEDLWSSSKDSEEEPMEFGYEKHFMPTAGEILEVA